MNSCIYIYMHICIYMYICVHHTEPDKNTQAVTHHYSCLFHKQKKALNFYYVGFCGVLWGFVGCCGVLWGVQTPEVSLFMTPQGCAPVECSVNVPALHGYTKAELRAPNRLYTLCLKTDQLAVAQTAGKESVGSPFVF